jgi:hypothetical protein
LTGAVDAVGEFVAEAMGSDVEWQNALLASGEVQVSPCGIVRLARHVSIDSRTGASALPGTPVGVVSAAAAARAGKGAGGGARPHPPHPPALAFPNVLVPCTVGLLARIGRGSSAAGGAAATPASPPGDGALLGYVNASVEGFAQSMGEWQAMKASVPAAVTASAVLLEDKLGKIHSLLSKVVHGATAGGAGGGRGGALVSQVAQKFDVMRTMQLADECFAAAVAVTDAVTEAHRVAMLVLQFRLAQLQVAITAYDAAGDDGRPPFEALEDSMWQFTVALVAGVVNTVEALRAGLPADVINRVKPAEGDVGAALDRLAALHQGAEDLLFIAALLRTLARVDDRAPSSEGRVSGLRDAINAAQRRAGEPHWFRVHDCIAPSAAALDDAVAVLSRQQQRLSRDAAGLVSRALRLLADASRDAPARAAAALPLLEAAERLQPSAEALHLARASALLPQCVAAEEAAKRDDARFAELDAAVASAQATLAAAQEVLLQKRAEHTAAQAAADEATTAATAAAADLQAKREALAGKREAAPPEDADAGVKQAHADAVTALEQAVAAAEAHHTACQEAAVNRSAQQEAASAAKAAASADCDAKDTQWSAATTASQRPSLPFGPGLNALQALATHAALHGWQWDAEGLSLRVEALDWAHKEVARRPHLTGRASWLTTEQLTAHKKMCRNLALLLLPLAE